MVMTYDEYLKKNKKKKEEPKVVLGYSSKNNVNNAPKSTTNTQTLIDKYVAEQKAKKSGTPVKTTTPSLLQSIESFIVNPLGGNKTNQPKTQAIQLSPTAGQINTEGYKDLGTTYGRYKYQNYAERKDYKIYEKEGKYYYYDEKRKVYTPIDQAEMTTKELDKKNYKEAKKQGYSGEQDLDVVRQIKLDTAGLTEEEYKDYKKDLVRQQKDEEEQQKRDNKVRTGGAGLKGSLGELEHLFSSAGENIDEEIIEPIRDAKGNYELGMMTEQLGLEAYKKMQGEKNNYDKLKKEYDKYASFNEDLVNEGNYLDQSIQTLPNQIGGMWSGIKGGGLGGVVGAGIGAGIGAFTKTPEGVILGANKGAELLGGAGYVAGQSQYTYQLEAGLQYQTLLDMGIPEDIAKKEAQDTGRFNALVESGESIVDLISLGQLSKVKDILFKNLAKEYGEEKVQEWILKSTLKNAVSEGVEEGVQEGGSIYNEKQAFEQAGMERDDSGDLERIKESIIAGAISGGLIAGGTNVVIGGAKVTSNTLTDKAIKDSLNKQIETMEANTGRTLTSEEKAELLNSTVKEIKNLYQMENVTSQDVALEEDIAPVGNNVVQQAGTQDIAPVKEQTANIKSQNYVSEAKETDSIYRKNLNEDASKYANNSTRTHEFVNTLSNVSESLGVNIRLTNSNTPEMIARKNKLIEDYAKNKNVSIEEAREKLKNTIINGYKTNDGVVINVDSPKALNRLVGHELTHVLEKTGHYEKLQKIALDFAKSRKDYQARLDIMESNYDGTDYDGKMELTADIIGDYLFSDKEFIRRIQREDRNLFQLIYDEIKHLIKLATANSKEQIQLEQLKYEFEKAMQEHKSGKTNKVTVQETKTNLATEVESNTQNKEEYSLSEQLEKNLENRLREADARIDFFEDYLEENDITNPTEKDMYDSWGTYEQMDADDNFKEAEQEYYKTIREYLNSSKDNKDRKLSEEQKDFFKDSKVRDKDGKLLTMYHGTRADFNVFESARAGQNYEDNWSRAGKGYYFTPDSKVAKDYGEASIDNGPVKIKEVYLNITNPFDMSVDYTETLKDMKAEYNIDDFYLKVGYRLIDWFKSQNIDSTEALKKYGFDGIHDFDDYVAFNSNQIKEVTNTNPTESDDIRYSLSVSEANTTKDNKGRTLSKAVIERNKDSKTVDENGNLITVYHTMTDRGTQFNEFNPVGTDYYRFGDQVVNYYTDSKDMSGSYANQRYDMADTKKLNSMEDAKKWLEDNRFANERQYDYDIKPTQSGFIRVVLYDYGSGNVIAGLDYSNEAELLKKLQRDVSGNIKDELEQHRLQYEGYVNITNPYVVDAKGRLWNNVQNDIPPKIKEQLSRITDTEKQALKQLANESASKHEELWNEELEDKYNAYLSAYHNQLTTQEQIEIVHSRVTGEAINSDKEMRLHSWIGNGPYIYTETLKDFANTYNQLAIDRSAYGEPESYFKTNYKDIININKIDDITAYELFKIAQQGFTKKSYKDALAEQFTTNDVVKQVIEMNKNGSNYDGVIFKNTKDYGGYSDKTTPADVFVTFNSNQFKAWDNESPTDDADIRYSLSKEEFDDLVKEQTSKYVGMTNEQLDREFTYANDSMQEMLMLSQKLSKEYKEFQETDEFKNALQNYDFESDAWEKAGEYADKIRYYDRNYEKYKAQREAINNLLMGNEVDTRTTQQIVDEAEERFGTTMNFKETAYITINGNNLDFSGKNDGGPAGRRSLDHREINEIDTTMEAFIRMGNIRLKPEGNGFEVYTMPNSKQISQLYDYIYQANGEIYVDVVKDDGTYDVSRWRKGTPAKKIISDLKTYFDTGKFPKQSEYAQFLSDDTSFSLSRVDNQGRELTEYTLEKTKNSKVRDENGNLMLMYHGSPNGTYDQLRAGTYFTSNKEYADGYQWEGASSISYGKQVNNPKTYEAYLNITNPFTLKDETAKNIYLNEYIKGGNSAYFDPYTDYTDTINNMDEIDWVEGVDLQEWLQENHPEYDGMYLDEGGAGGYGGAEYQWRGYSVIPFSEEQIIKANNNNTEYSLSRTTDEIAPVKDADVFGSDIALQEAIAPLQEQVQKLTKAITDLQENIAPAPRNLAEEEGDRTLQQMTDEDAPVDEGTFTFLDNEIEVKKKQEIVNEIASDFNIKKTEARELYNKIDSIAEPTVEDIVKELEAYREVKFQEDDDYVKSIQDYIRGTRLDISEIKKQIPDYGNKYRMSNMGKGLILGNSGQSIDSFYQELNELSPNEFPLSVTAEADQLELISEFMYKDKEITYTDILDDDTLQILAQRIYSDIGNHERYRHTQSGLYFLNKELKNMTPPYEVDNDIPVASNTEQVEDIAPIGEKTFEKVAKKLAEKKLAKQSNTATPKVENNTPRIEKSKYRNFRDTTQRLFVNEMVETDNLAKESGNLNIKFKGDMLNAVAGEIEGEISVAQTDNEGHAIGKSVSGLFQKAKETGLYDAFNDYLEHYSNIDRHAQGKGSKTPLEVSQKLVKEYERTYPEFKQWGKDVWKYGANVRDNLIDAGIINEQFAETLGTMYPHYVPFMENREMSNYNPDLGEIKPKGVIKRAVGGAESLLPIEDALTKYTFGYKKAVRQNQFYQEIVKTLGPGVDVGADVRNDAIDLADTLYKDETGNYLTAYVDGERVSTRISDDLYIGLKNDLSSQIKGLEEKYALITEPVQKISEIRRNLLTSWSPMFILRNPIMDVQDALFNSKYTTDFMKNYPGAFVELGKANTETVRQFLTLYGSGNVMGEHSSDGTVKKSNFLKGIQRANNVMELAPRYAEFKASLQNGASIQEAMYNAREVTTNFSRGGTITKALNKNGFTFLNVSVQGFDKFIRNFSGENGAKGFAGALLKATVLGVAPALFNELIYGFGGDEEDEEYEALPDYIKDNYYLIKTGEGEFIRIPKGRMLSVFGSAGRRTLEYLGGEKDAFEGFLDNANSQVGISNPLDNNILAPLFQAYGSENGEAWYGGDLVPSRLQKKAPEEQYDASTDKMSIWLGDKLKNVPIIGDKIASPYKLNYVIDQYSGGIGDIFLPFITEESTSDAEGLGMVLAPIKDQFTANSTSDNKYAGEIYDLSDKMDKMPEATKETDEYKIQDAYLYSVTSEMGKLYEERRQVQANKNLSKSEKYKKVQAIQDQINDLAKEGMENYQNVSKTDVYAIVGGREFNKYTTDDGTERWGSVFEDTLEDLNSLGMDLEEKSTYFKATKTISSIQDSYKDSEDYVGKKQDIISTIKGTNLTGEQKAYLYDKYYGNSDVVEAMVTLNVDIDSFLDYEAQDFEADKYANGKTVPNSKKRKVFEYINSMPIEFEQRLILAKLQYPSYNEYNPTIINYLNNSDMTYEQEEVLLKKLGFKVDENGNIRW